jgi:ATP-dependent DNA helicase DinG
VQDILEFFPLTSEPRPKQVKALQFFQEAVQRGYKDIVVEAPTGVGKSAIGVCASFWIAQKPSPNEKIKSGSYYLVTQKLLQDQLTDDVPRYQLDCQNCASIKTSEEYPCTTFGTCGAGLRVESLAKQLEERGQNEGKKRQKCQSIELGSCSYRIAKNKFTSSTAAITNYPYFFTSKLYTEDLKKRQLLICDEGHSTEGQIVRFVDGTVSLANVRKWTDLKEIPKLDTLLQYTEWLEKTYLPKIKETYDNMMELELLADSTTDERGKEITELDKHICKLWRAIAHLKENLNNWVFWREESKDSQDFQYVARPIFGAPYADFFLRSCSEVRLYMSAYLGSKEVYCRNLGLDPNTVAWLSLDSDFKPENRRIHYFPTGSMSLRNKEETTPNLLRAVIKIANKQLDRGLIHTQSYELGLKIETELIRAGHGDRVTFPKNSDEREEAFDNHAKKKNSIIISPSMKEGFDFKDDLARWQIIAKVPFPSLSDRQIAARLARDDAWYTQQTVGDIIQACGRICRSEVDRGVTFVLDSDFKKLYFKAISLGMIPNWWSEAVVFHG